MTATMEDIFLDSCKMGQLDVVKACVEQGCDPNTANGWALRRAVRYGFSEVWQFLLACPGLQVNLPNQYGLTALHTACRFNIPGAVYDLLRVPGILVNEKTRLGSSPVMVAAKYCRKEAIAGLIKDRRVDLDTRDEGGRKVEEVVGVAVHDPVHDEVHEVVELLSRERLGRTEEEGRRDSMEEESIDVDGLHRSKVFDNLKELVGELKGLHMMDRMKLLMEQEQESSQFVIKLEREMVSFLDRQREDQDGFANRLLKEKKDFDSRQQEGLGRLLRKQDQEYVGLQHGSTSNKSTSDNSPKSTASRQNSRRPSLKTHQEVPSCESLSDSSGPSLWEWTVPDEGYCTGSTAPGGGDGGVGGGGGCG